MKGFRKGCVLQDRIGRLHSNGVRSAQYAKMGLHQGERTNGCRAVMKELASNQPDCVYCGVPPRRPLASV